MRNGYNHSSRQNTMKNTDSNKKKKHSVIWPSQPTASVIFGLVGVTCLCPTCRHTPPPIVCCLTLLLIHIWRVSHRKWLVEQCFLSSCRKLKSFLQQVSTLRMGSFFFFFLSFLLFLFPTVEIKSNCQVYWILGHTHWLQVMTVFCIQVEIKQMSKYPYQHSYLWGRDNRAEGNPIKAQSVWARISSVKTIHTVYKKGNHILHRADYIFRCCSLLCFVLDGQEN